MNNNFYFSTSPAEAAAILRNGFQPTSDYKIVDAPVTRGRQVNPDDDDKLIEITLLADISQFAIDDEEGDRPWRRWRAWIVPASLLNDSATLRLVPAAESARKWEEWNRRCFDRHLANMAKLGLAEIVRDSEGQPITSAGKTVYRLTAKGERQGLKQEMIQRRSWFAPNEIPAAIRTRLKQLSPDPFLGWDWHDRCWVLDLNAGYIRIIPLDDNGEPLQKTPDISHAEWVIDFIIDDRFVTLYRDTLGGVKDYLDSLLERATPQFPRIRTRRRASIIIPAVMRKSPPFCAPVSPTKHTNIILPGFTYLMRRVPRIPTILMTNFWRSLYRPRSTCRSLKSSKRAAVGANGLLQPPYSMSGRHSGACRKPNGKQSGSNGTKRGPASAPNGLPASCPTWSSKAYSKLRETLLANPFSAMEKLFIR